MRLFGTQKTRLHSSVPWPHLKMPIDSCLLFCFSSLDFTLHFLKHTVWGLLPIIVSIPPQSGFHFVSASPLWPNNAESELMRKRIKGPDNPTCQLLILLPISSKRKVKTGWEKQERERRWWKTDRAREFCVRRLRVRRFDYLCIGKSMCEICGDGGRQFVWKR